MQDVITKGICHGTYVITVQAEEDMNGMTAAWVSQVSMRPLFLMVSIAPLRYTHGLIEKAGSFVINTLPEGRQDLARHFGFSSGRKTNKFEGIPYFRSTNGAPVLEDAMAYFECNLITSLRAGDHTLFIGEVMNAKVLKENSQALLFRWKDYF